MSESLENCIKNKEEQDQQRSGQRNCFQEECSHNQSKINQMQSFIDKKYTQINDLQKYLLEELQYIENCKNRNQHIEDLLVRKVIPIFGSIRSTMKTVKECITPICALAKGYMETVVEKCKDLLQQKQIKSQEYQKENKELERQVLKLTKQVIQLRESNKSSRQIQAGEQERKQKEGLQQIYSLKSLENQRINSIDMLPYFQGKMNEWENNISDSKKNLNHLSQNKRIEINGSTNSKSSSKLHQHLKRNENEMKSPITIQYKCQKPSIFQERRKSPSPLKPNENKQYCRKQYIKQKIEKIKTKPKNERFQMTFNPSRTNDY